MAIESQPATDAKHDREVRITSRILGDPAHPLRLAMDRDDLLEQVITETLKHEHLELPAPPERPLDQLHNLGPQDEPGPVIENLEQPLWEYLRQSHTTRDFGVHLVLAIRVNHAWAVAPEAEMTPRAILQLFHLDPAEFSLYLPEAKEPLPPDVPVKLERGKIFEAQKDGKYGATAAELAAPSLTKEVDALQKQGVDLSRITIGDQAFAHVRKLRTPTPPWGKAAHDILIALPVAEGAALDAFYLELPYAYNGGAEGHVGGAEVTYDGRQWKLVSWHYVDGHPWAAGRDTLSTHIAHCRGFFTARGLRG